MSKLRQLLFQAEDASLVSKVADAPVDIGVDGTIAADSVIQSDAAEVNSAAVSSALSVANATALTLSTAWAFTSGVGITYTISEISKWPARFDDVIMYKAALIIDPDSVNLKKWEGIYTEAVGLDKAENTRRRASSEFKSFPGRRK